MFRKSIKKNKGCAVVLGLGVNGLGHVRSLGKKGISVYGIYHSKFEYGRYSKYCTAINLSKEHNDKTVFKERLIQIAKNLPQRPVLFLTSDFYVNFIAEYKDEISRYFYLNLPDKDTISAIVNKHLMGQIASKNGLSVPETFFLNSEHDLSSFVSQINYPCLIKPINSFSVKFPQKTILMNNKESLQSFFRLNPKYFGKTILQELIPGKDSDIYQCTAYLSSSSSALAAFTMRKIRQYPPSFGVTSYGISLRIEKLIDATKIFLKKINYKGFCSLEYKWDKNREKFYFIEMNPRLPHYSSLFYDSGVNLPFIAYSDLRYPDKNIINSIQIPEISWIYFHFDLFTLLAQKKIDNSISIFKWIKTIFSADSFAYWDKKDPLPCIASYFNLLKSLRSKITN